MLPVKNRAESGMPERVFDVLNLVLVKKVTIALKGFLNFSLIALSTAAVGQSIYILVSALCFSRLSQISSVIATPSAFISVILLSTLWPNAVILRWVGVVFQHGTVSRNFTVKVDCATNAVAFWNSSGNTCR